MADLTEPELQTEDGQPPKQEPDELAGLKAALAKERELRRAIEKAAKTKANLDPEEYEQLKARAEEQDRKEAEAKGNYEKLLANERKKAELSESKYKSALQQSNEALADAALVAAFVANGGKPEHLDNFKVLAKSKLEKDEMGRYVIPDSYTKEDGEAVTEFADFVAIARDKGGLGFAFAPLNQAKGSNSTGGADGAPAGIKYVTPAEASKYIKEIASGEVIVRG